MFRNRHITAEQRPFGRMLVAFEDQSASDESIEIPEDLTALSDEDLANLANQATEAFDSLYGDGQNLSDEDVQTLSALTEGIERVTAEQGTREEAAAARQATAAELAARVRPAADEVTEDPAPEADPEPEAPVEDVVEEPEAVAASGARGSIRVPLSQVRSRRPAAPQPRVEDVQTMSSVVRAADVPGMRTGEGLDWLGVGRAVNARLGGFNASQYASASKRGVSMRERLGVAVIDRGIPADLTIENQDPEAVRQVIDRAIDQSRLPEGSLVASGGWCAPSQVTYDLLELESTDGIISTPEVGITRGGIQWTPGPDFAEIYGAVGFSFTEAEDEDGLYAPGEDGNVEGDKPCYKVPCADFEEARLDVVGLCLTAGLLQQRGYPELIARTARGAMVAHQHKVAARKIAAMAAGSDAVAMPADQVGATAPILTAIELQVEHYRTVHRLARSAALEAVFPFWVRGAIRSDLSRRLGVDLIDVPDARIDAWFRARGVNAQFVYNYQDITGDASAFTGWANEVRFLLYAAGTWVAGTNDVITLDTIYDSVNLGQNDYTALFTEEGLLMMKAGHDSREVTVPICPSGATAGGVLIACNGTEGAEG